MMLQHWQKWLHRVAVESRSGNLTYAEITVQDTLTKSVWVRLKHLEFISIPLLKTEHPERNTTMRGH